jgi:type IV pilus assembly protein PilV
MKQFSNPKQSGASLIEVLVAILIFSIGMLGIAALSSAAIRYQTGNVARSAIASSINDYADRLRGNLYGANGYSAPSAAAPSTGYVYTATYTTQQSGTITFPTTPNCASTTCSLSELSNYDITAWRQSLRNNLPGGAGYVVGDYTTGFDVTVMWYDKEFAVSNDNAFTDNPDNSRQCRPSDSPASAAARFCCPENAEVIPGVRCYTTKIFP